MRLTVSSPAGTGTPLLLPTAGATVDSALARRHEFPPDFVWGAATSAYQIEGRTPDDGRGDCIWTAFSHTPGKTYNGDTGDIAIQHLTHYADDIALMQSIGLRAYRFSFSWPRLLPDGTGTTNPRGFEFYDRLIDGLLEAGIRPFATLYHWDLPLALQAGGSSRGWASRDIVEQFADYAELAARHFGDRVQHWFTINEPWCVAHLGHLFGIHAPGMTDALTAFRAAHHTLLAHAAAVPRIRQHVPGAKVGIAPNLYPVYAASEREEDVEAAMRQDAFQNRWFLDPLYRGAYPADFARWLDARGILDGLDLVEVSAAAVATDFLGINYYSRAVRAAAAEGEPGDWPGNREIAPAGETTAMGWEVYPAGLTDILSRVAADYAPAGIYITENGAAYHDTPVSNKQGGVTVDDDERTRFLAAHFAAATDAVAGGVPLNGFFVWSLFDNFEWSEGYRYRFGIVHVDYATQQRTLKASAHFYRRWLGYT